MFTPEMDNNYFVKFGGMSIEQSATLVSFLVNSIDGCTYDTQVLFY